MKLSPVLFAITVAACSMAAVRPVYAQQEKTQAAKPSPSAMPRSTVYDHPLLQKKVTLSLKDADINTAAQELSKSSGVSLVVEKQASTLGARPVTLTLTEATLGNVLDALGTAYGYRWRRKGDVFLLTLAPVEEDEKDMEEFGKRVVSEFYEKVLTPEQRALTDRQGYIDAKDLTPGQKGVVSGLFQEMMRRVMSSQIGSQIEVGRITLDMANRKFGITAGNPSEGNKQ